VFVRKIFKNLCTRIAGWRSKCDGEWAHRGLGLLLLPSHNRMGNETTFFTIVTHNSHYVKNYFLPFFGFTTMSDFFLGGKF
jgi:hypothetical protein